jgi:thiopurine S-methyltransferase
VDLRLLKLHVPERTCHVILREAQGDAAHDLSGASFDRVLSAAEPLLLRLSQEGGGPVQHLSIDAPGESLTATCMKQFDQLPTGADERALLHRHGASMGEVGEVPSHLASITFADSDFRHLHSLLREVVKVAQREAHPRPPDPPGQGATDAAAWEHKYHGGGDGWELMRPAPPLARYLVAHPPAAGALALVPGCGRGHEARLLAGLGATVVAIDLAKSALSEARRLTPETGSPDGGRLAITWRQADLFALPGEPGERGRYDLVLEHCCFCAIDPQRRDEYVQAVAALLKPGGRLLGLFWCFEQAKGRPGGPPFPATRDEMKGRFAARFDLLSEENPADSVLSRSGQEVLLHLQVRPF